MNSHFIAFSLSSVLAFFQSRFHGVPQGGHREQVGVDRADGGGGIHEQISRSDFSTGPSPSTAVS
jgi:hypothetical protein